MKQFYILLSLILATSFSQVNADILYVKPGASSTAWQNQTNVYSDLQTALAVAVDGDEVWVAAGIYKPTNDDNRDISFELKDGVHYYGGFSGSETELSQRNWRDNETILSGDIGVEGDVLDNSRQVVTLNEAADVSTEYRTFLDGFVIEDGKGHQGGGFFIGDGDPIVRNCWFRNNHVSYRGGAIKSEINARPLYGNVIFSNNYSEAGGAAVFSYRKCSFYNCIWYENEAQEGALVSSYTTDIHIYNSLAFGNKNLDGSNPLNDFHSYSSRMNFGQYVFEPLFVDPDQGDFRLADRAAAINGGDNANVPDWLTIDFGGSSRIMDGVVDMGIFEGFVEVPEAKSPKQDSIFNTDKTQVELSWGWREFSPDIASYAIQFKINQGETFLFSEISSASYTISSLQGGDKVVWRVAAVLESGEKRWSSWRRFFINRGHYLYIKPNASGDGSSWINATNFQHALDISINGDTLWVASGIYKPTDDGDRNVSFEIKEGVKIFGGFSGTETTLGQRNWNNNKTILSGNIGNEDDDTDNSYHVIRSIGTIDSPVTSATVFDGFIVEKGYANRDIENSDGGGLLLRQSSPLIKNVLFRKNYARSQGGAIWSDFSSKAQFGNVIFSNNESKSHGGAVNDEGNLKFYNSVWYNNHSRGWGGAVRGLSTIIINSIALGNKDVNGNDAFSGPDVSFSMFPNGSSNNFLPKPVFIDPEKGDFRIRQGSPTINAGSLEKMPDWLLLDYYGDSRIQEDTIDIGIVEGYVQTPTALSPATKSVFESGVTEVILEWEWKNALNDTPRDYELEYVINDNDTTIVSNIQELTFSISGLNPLDKIEWRVRGLDGAGEKNWSQRNNFYISRGHPIFVKPNSIGNGSSWANAMNLQDALNVSVFGDSLWVAEGTYKPTNDGDYNVSFELKDGVSLFGGFSGNETEMSEMSQRDWQKNETILSGDIGVEGDETDNSYHVLTAKGTGSFPITDKTRLDGFIIEKGYAGRHSERNGGGLFLQYASPVIMNCHFKNNYAYDSGGAVYVDGLSNGLFCNVIFSGNSAGFDGGAVFGYSSALEFYNCVWYKNQSNRLGGAIRGHYVKVYNSIALHNSSSIGNYDFYGGDIFYSIYKGGSYDNNISVDPRFIDPENGDFRIRNNSPAINGGNSENLPDLLVTDFSGNARIQNDTIDIGVFEGWVETPLLKSPHNGAALESTVDEVLLEWQWENGKPEYIKEYDLEYVINGDTTIVKNITQSSYTLFGLTPVDVVNWEVAGVTDSGQKNLSVNSKFVISREHPLYVKPESNGDGSSWWSAMDLQTALDTAIINDQIWVAAGTYKPTDDGDRSVSFELKEGVRLYGGFAGTETSLEQRNWNKNKTILSGNIGETAESNDNSYNVVDIEGTPQKSLTNKCVLDGVIIENGFADGYNYGTDNDGGGLNVSHAAPIVRNVWFRHNYSDNYGGAVYLSETTAALFGNVLFTDNKNDYYGGAVYDNGAAEFFNCIWYGNFSKYGDAVEGSSQVFNSLGWNNKNSHNDDRNFAYEVSVFNSIDSESASQDDTPGFIDPDKGDFRIREGSPGINAGKADTIPDWLATDFWGAPRVAEDTVDIGLMEGYVITPELISPADEHYFNADSLNIQLEWGWADSIPENITGYELEYFINNGDTLLVDSLKDKEFLLTELKPADVVHWRVCSVEESGLRNWSAFHKFTIYRDHPLYVKEGGNGDGNSWLDAMSLHGALEKAIKNDEIWVAAGTYKPTDTNDREISFEVREDVKLYGGFSGDEQSLDERNWQINETILSGDIGIVGNSDDNSFTILYFRGYSENPLENIVVDGFFIENGNASSRGGGVTIRTASGIFKNLWFRDNIAPSNGGAVYVHGDSDVDFHNVLFVNNKSGYNGGAVYVIDSDVSFSSCLWYGNSADNSSGAVFESWDSDIEVINSVAWNNEAPSNIDFNFSNQIHNSIFADADGSNGNISENPLFVDPENDSFLLQRESPAISAGDNERVPDNLLFDFAGIGRIFGENVDIGPYEYVHLENVSPRPGGSGTKEFNMLMMLELVWGISDGTMTPQTNIPSDFEYQMKLWKVGDEDNLLEDGPFNAYSGTRGSNNSTHIGNLEYGTAYQWSIGLDYDNYVVWSDPTAFYIGHDHSIHVKEGSNGTTGSSWADAFGTLTEAIDYAIPGDEIWVAGGTYYPVTPNDAGNVTQAEREQALSLKPGLVFYGGMAGNESNAWDRNHVENPTILSGDIGVTGDNSDNSVNLIRNEFDASAPLQNGTVVEGFIFEGATGSAIYNVNASPSVEYSIFRNNEGENGGAVYNESSSPYFFNVLFHKNKVSGDGGAIYADVNSKPELLSSTVTDNTATITGGLSGVFDVKNSIVYGNENGQFSVEESSVVYSCVEGGYEGEENISYDPMWTDPANDDYTLQKYSSCIDQGNQSFFLDLFTYDLAKRPRTHVRETDMGAFEAQVIGGVNVVETSISADSSIDFIDSLIIRFNKPIAVDTAIVPVLDPTVEIELKVSDDDPNVLIIKHPGLQVSSDYHLELPGGQVTLANNDMIFQWFLEYDFTTRACIPVELSVDNSDVNVCPRTSVTLKAEISGDALDYFWVFNLEDTLSRNDGSLLIDTVMPENTGEYILKTTDWCGSSDEISLNLQYKSGTELIVPEPKWNTVYFVDNNTGNLSDIKWYLDGVEVSDKQYLDTKSLEYGELTVVAFDEASQCLIYGEVGQLKSASLKSALVSPNPVASGNPVDIVLPEVSEKSRIRLYDMRGAKLIDQEFVESGILQLEDTDFSSGVYLLQIEYNDGFIENKKLIIE